MQQCDISFNFVLMLYNIVSGLPNLRTRCLVDDLRLEI